MEQENVTLKECSRTILAINDTMEILSGKWKVSIIACLCFHPMRYSQLLKDIHGISGKMLSRELKELEANGLITRTVTTASPIAVEYSITEYGHSLKQLTQTIAEWGLNHRRRIIGEMKKEKAE